MGRVTPLNELERRRIAAVYSRTQSMLRTAEEVGRSISTVCRVLHAQGVQVRPRGGVHHFLPQWEMQRTIDLYLHGNDGRGMYMREVAEELGLAQSTVWHRLHQAGVTRSEPIEDIRGNCNLPLEPFAEWVEMKIEELGGVEAFASAAGFKDSRPVRRIVSRMEDGKPKRFIRLDTVDRVVTTEGSTLLQEIYPALYEDLGRAA